MREISGKRLCRFVEKHGWVLNRIHGSHHIYVHPGRPQILSIPVHGNQGLQKGILRGLLKAAGLNEEDLIDA